MKRLLFFFLDGVGLALPDAANPLSGHEGAAFRHLAHGQRWCQPFEPHASSTHLVRPLDATLGVDGLPQSGTGQASLFTGVNCAEVVGRHFGPFPHSKTHETLDEKNIFRQVQNLERRADAPTAFANAFPPQFFDAPRRRATVTTYCCNAASVPLRDIEALREKHALSADLTGTAWREHLDLDIPDRSLATAAQTLRAITQHHTFTLFEYFLTDKVGHRRIDTAPEALLDTLDAFLSPLLDELDPAHDTLLITSDHGNFEDTSHTQHTRNPVPLIVYGWAAPFFTEATALTDVTPGIVRALRSTT
jgi:hypothetical protein